jgi:hypothetical protein
MKAVVVYESAFGNTHRIAEAVAEGLQGGAQVEVRPVAEATTDVLQDAGLLVVGGPTHVHGMASKMSMKGAAEDARKRPGAHLEPGAEGPLLRDWLDGLVKAEHVPAAAFDTRIGKPRVFTGSAAKGIAKRLKRHGYQLVSEPASFLVDTSPGTPLHEGELERAREWGRTLAQTLTRAGA